MATSQVSDELWEESHVVVNMTSRELADWLRAEAATDLAEVLPDQSENEVGREVLSILGKRRADLTQEDIAVMEAVVTEVRTERGEDPLEPTAGEDGWRRRLMSLGHDPLKPA